jgi:hypothetical protein
MHLISLVARIIVLLGLLLPGSVPANPNGEPVQTAETPPPRPETPVMATTVPGSGEADLILMNRHVVRFRSSLLGSPASQRAERGERNLTTILARDESDEVKVQHNQMGNIFLVGGQLAFILTHDDVDRAQRRNARRPHPQHPGQAAPGHRRDPREP